MSSTFILLKNGIALLHDANDHVVPTKTDILIRGQSITMIKDNIIPDGDVDVIDCTDKLISPGFIDTHHHGWQTQLKGRHADQYLLDYMIHGNAQSFQYTPAAIFYGQLAGMLEALIAGTTTVVDHAHLTYSPDHARMGISATISSGIRSIFCYTPIMRLKQFSPMTPDFDVMPSWVMQTFSELAAEGPWSDGRVTLGFAYDLFFLGDEKNKDTFNAVRKAGVKTVTTHYSTSIQIGTRESVALTLHRLGELDSRVILSHANLISQEEAELVKRVDASIVSTPSTELQMMMNRPLCFDAAHEPSKGLQSYASLGIDCHSNNSGSIIEEARIGLQNARNFYNERFISQNKTTWKMPDNLSVEAAFNLATIQGAKAVNRDDIGKLGVGMKADIVIWDALSPGMVAAAQHDGVAAIILHSSPADVDTVIVDGLIRKREGKLVDVSVDQKARQLVGKEKLQWKEIAKAVVESREVIQAEIDKIDFADAKDATIKAFGVDTSVFVDTE